MILDTFLLKSCSKAAPAALGGCGGLGQLWEALYIEKLPINRTSGRYVRVNICRIFHRFPFMAPVACSRSKLQQLARGVFFTSDP